MSLPVATLWILARSKTRDDKKKSYYGAYPAGLLERIRNTFLNGNRKAIIWHVCSGYARNYNTDKLWGFGKNDLTLDIDPETKPDICMDVREITTRFKAYEGHVVDQITGEEYDPPDLILIDRPYDPVEAEHYNCGPEVLPNINKLTKDCLELASSKCPVAVIDYYWPAPGPAYQEYAAIGVSTGRNNKARILTVWKKIKS